MHNKLVSGLVATDHCGTSSSVLLRIRCQRVRWTPVSERTVVKRTRRSLHGRRLHTMPWPDERLALEPGIAGKKQRARTGHVHLVECSRLRPSGFEGSDGRTTRISAIRREVEAPRAVFALGSCASFSRLIVSSHRGVHAPRTVGAEQHVEVADIAVLVSAALVRQLFWIKLRMPRTRQCEASTCNRVDGCLLGKLDALRTFTSFHLADQRVVPWPESLMARNRFDSITSVGQSRT